MLDLTQLIVNAKKDAKLDTKSQRYVINEVADIKVYICSLAKSSPPAAKNPIPSLENYMRHHASFLWPAELYLLEEQQMT